MLSFLSADVHSHIVATNFKCKIYTYVKMVPVTCRHATWWSVWCHQCGIIAEL